MSYIDVMIPGVAGLLLLLSPQLFLARQSTHDQSKIRMLRISGITLTLVAVLYLAIMLFR